MPTTLGTDAKTLFVKSESHKLHHEFKANEPIRKGMLVELDADGGLVKYDAVNGNSRPFVIGVAIHDGELDEKVTVACKGYMITKASASASFDAGPIHHLGTFDSDGYPKVNADDGSNNTETGWAIEASAAAGDIIDVIISA